MNSRFFKLIISIAIFLAVVLVFSCQVEAKRSKPSSKPKDSNSAEKTAVAEPNVSGPASHIKFDLLVHDFCEVAPDSINKCTFKFTNTGPGKLVITQTRGTCKCTVPELGKKEYNSGESGEINVFFHAPVFPGPTSQNVIVSNNDPENSKVELAIMAHIISKVRATPDILNLSLIDPNNAGAVPITIQSIDKGKFAILSIASEGNVFTIPFDPNDLSDTHTLYPKVNIDNLTRYLGGYIVFTINHSDSKSVRVQYNCLKEFEASPSVIIIRDAIAGELQTRTIYLVSNYNQPVDVETITAEKGIIKVIGKEHTENSFKIDVQITPPTREGDLRVFSDTLHIKIKNKDDIAIPCRGFYRAGR